MRRRMASTSVPRAVISGGPSGSMTRSSSPPATRCAASPNRLRGAVTHPRSARASSNPASRISTSPAPSAATSWVVAALGAGLVLILLAGLLLARALRGWVTAPLSRLGDAAQRVAGGELDRVIEPDGPPEITALGTDVEAMRRRIVNELTEVAAAHG